MAIKAIRERIDTGAVTPMMLAIVFIGFMLNLVDGFDVVAMSAAAPSLLTEWEVSRSELGPIFSSALIGMAIGAALIAPLADRFGRRLLVILATIAIGLSMMAVVLIPKGNLALPLMIAIRFISGLGIGVIFASGAAIASEFVPEKYRNLAVTLAIMGYPFGAMFVGPVANLVIPLQGWEMLFVYGGIATLAMGIIIFFVLPESPEFLANREPTDETLDKLNRVLLVLKREPFGEIPKRESKPNIESAKVSSLLTREFRTSTLALWTIYFMGLFTIYFLLSWIPTLFVDSGFSRAEGINALTLLNLGAVIGILLIGILITNVKLAKPIAIYFLLAAVLLVALYLWRPNGLIALNIFIFCIGLSLQGAFTAIYALAARVYPATIRTTGIGWAAGLGRVGGIVSPVVIGLLAASGWNMFSLFLLSAVPLIIAGILVLKFRD